MNHGVVLTGDQMRAVEKAAIDGGVSAAALMEKAGASIAHIVQQAWTQRPTVVVCGPGSNGGDGYVAARELKTAGWPVTVLSLITPDQLSGEAKLMAELFDGDIKMYSPAGLNGAGLIIDAIFGTGLSRAVEGEAQAAIQAINASPAAVLAVDLPSGINADTGAVMGEAVVAQRSVTFFARKPGHLLFPGRAHCGMIDIADIGIDANAASTIKPDHFENHPGLWGNAFRRPDWRTHKYTRGHVFVVSGPAHQTGAARLAAMAAARIGAGLTTVLSPESALGENSGHVTAIMVKPADNFAAIESALQEKSGYRRVCVIGPGGGVGETLKANTIAALGAASAVVADADALTSFESDAAILFEALRPDDVITPHEGEFHRLFQSGNENRIDKARAAAREAGCVVVLKGADTIIAAADGRTAINVNAPPDLATAGAGDVLAGLIAGLSANGMTGFAAACAGAWFHGAAAQRLGPGLIADDLPGAIPEVLRALMAPPRPEGETT